MKALFPAGLRAQRVASVLLALFFLGLEGLFFILVGILLLAQRLWKNADAGHWAWVAGAALLACTWGLARAVKNGHFLWLYGRWPLDDAALTADDPLWRNVQQAYAADEQPRVQSLVGRLAPEERSARLWSGLGRSLALDGRLQEAADAFEASGVDHELLRWLRPRRAWGLNWAVYFKPADARWARRHLWLVLLAALLALAALRTVERFAAMRDAVAGLGFNAAGFEKEKVDSFSFYYHDPAFMELSADVATAAMRHHLAFLGRDGYRIAPGSLKIFLCEDRAEYLRRAPYAPSWEQASALPELNSIYLYKLPPEQKVYYEVVLAHELSHLLYHRFFPVQGNDAWLNEGLADYLGFAFALDRAGIARQAWLMQHSFKGLGKHYLPFQRFFDTDPHSLNSDEEVSLFYRQGFSVVYMLIENYGHKEFLAFLDAYHQHDGDVSAALHETYPTIQNLAALGAVWGLFFEDELSAQ